MTRWTWINYEVTLEVDNVHAIILMPWCTSSSGNVNVKWSEMLSIFPEKENRDKLSDCLTNKCWYNIWIQYIFQTLGTSAVSVQWTLLLSEHFLRLRWSSVKQMRGTHKTDEIHFLQHPTGLLPWKHQSQGWAWVSVITNVHLRPSITCLPCIVIYLLLWFHFFSVCWAARKVTECQA